MTNKVREYYVNKVMDEMRKIVPTVYREHICHKDGEVVVGRDCMGDVQFLVTFDPETCAKMDIHIAKGTLFHYVHKELYQAEK